jgi:hypothetical protein
VSTARDIASISQDIAFDPRALCRAIDTASFVLSAL